MLRLHDHVLDDEARTEYGIVLLLDSGGEQWLIDMEEGKGNLLFLEDPARALSESPWYSDFVRRTPIARPSPDHPLKFLVTEPITSVDVISREPEDDELPDYHAMCGLRLTTTSGSRTCFGGYLRASCVTSELAFLFPDEVAADLRFEPLCGSS